MCSAASASQVLLIWLGANSVCYTWCAHSHYWRGSFKPNLQLNTSTVMQKFSLNKALSLNKTNQDTVTSVRTLRSLVSFPFLVNLLNWPFLTASRPEWLLSTPVKGFTLSFYHYPLLYNSTKSPQYLDKNMPVFIVFHWRKHNICFSLCSKYKLHENEFTYYKKKMRLIFHLN